MYIKEREVITVVAIQKANESGFRFGGRLTTLSHTVWACDFFPRRQSMKTFHYRLFERIRGMTPLT